MGAVKDTVHNLREMLDRNQKEARSLVNTMHKLQEYLEEEPKSIIRASLDRLLSRIRMEVNNLIGGSARVLVSPEWRVTVETTYSDEESDPRLRRLKSQDFSILTLPRFSYFIESLKSQVAEGNLIPVIEFLRANTKFEWAPVYLPTPAVRKAEQPREPSSSSEWKLPGWLPAFPWEGPPLPRGLFKD
jgi:hypothetical protein